jgi:hypothetical protein
MPRRLHPFWLAATALLAASVSGCGKLREISQCRAIAREVNPALDQIEALSKKPGLDGEARMAKHYAELAKRLKPHAAGNGTLQVAIKDYASVLEATGKALQSHADAARTGVTGRVNEPRRELERLVKRERAAVARLDLECHS